MFFNLFTVSNRPNLSIVLRAFVERRTLTNLFNHGTNIRFDWRFMLKTLFDRLLAWLTLWPTCLIRPVKTHLRDIFKDFTRTDLNNQTQLENFNHDLKVKPVITSHLVYLIEQKCFHWIKSDNRLIQRVSLASFSKFVLPCAVITRFTKSFFPRLFY